LPIRTGSGADTRVLWGCFLDVVNARACIGTAVALFPVVKRHNEAVALGFVTSGARSRHHPHRRGEPPGSRDPAAGAHRRIRNRHGLTRHHGQVAGRVRDWTFLLGPSLMPGINALLPGPLMYRPGSCPATSP
jgi:hypothetical protein